MASNRQHPQETCYSVVDLTTSLAHGSAVLRPAHCPITRAEIDTSTGVEPSFVPYAPSLPDWRYGPERTISAEL
jgi:hypothetical protein